MQLSYPILCSLGALALSGCVRAAHPAEIASSAGGAAWEGAFSVAAPAGWEVTRNYRWMGNHLFTFTSPDRDSAITIELIREDRASRALPLSLVSEGVALETGRVLGIEASRIAQHQIEIDGREAWVTTVRRSHGPHAQIASIAALRYDRYLTLLTLHTPPDGPLAAVRAWEGVLWSFDLPGPELPPGGIPVLFDTRDQRPDAGGR